MSTTFLLFVALYFTSVEIATGQDINNVCVSPKRDPDFDPKWVHDNTPEGGAHIIYGNSVMRRHFSRVLLGRELIEDEDFSKMCFKAGFHVTHELILGDYRGYGNGIADGNCSHTKGVDISCKFTNEQNPSFEDEAKPFGSYVDKNDFRSFHVAIFCFKNGDVGWGATSIKRNKLTDEEKGRILKHIESLGFDPKDTQQLYEDSCGMS